MEALLPEDLPHLHLWATFGIILVAVYLYASERLSLVLTSSIVVSAFLLLFHFFPLASDTGLFDPNTLLLGFANPALIAVLSLLVLGQAVVRTGSLTIISNMIVKLSKRSPFLAIVMTLFIVCIVSAVINNTPTVVIFIPILLAVAENLNKSASKVMIPLSYASILGGTTVLIGSSTNLLVSAAIVPLGLEPLGFFDFTIPGLVIAAVGLAYIILILPRMLPNRGVMSDELTGGSGRQFVAQLEIASDSTVVGKSINDPELFGEHEITLKMVQRKEQAYLAPFDDNLTIESDDVIIVTATRATIKQLLSESGQSMFRTKSTIAERDEEGRETRAAESALAEVLITPGSRLLGQNIEQIGFHHNYHSIVLGIQRKARMITSRMTEIRLAAGDVLLVMGEREDIRTIRESKDMVVMDWSTEDLPSKKYALRVNAIFAAVIACAATNTLPIHIAAFVGAVCVVLTGCLNIRQAMRSLDAPIIFLVAAGLAMSTALQATGGAALLAHTLVELTLGVEPVFVMSAMFLLIAVLTNILSNNATALLFTPIAVSTALELQVAPEMFIFAVIFASNCCALASPIGYQTNLLVMGPGHYKFKDYMVAGIPLVILVWITYTAFSYFYFV